MRRIVRFVVRLGVLAVLVAVVLKALEDKEVELAEPPKVEPAPTPPASPRSPEPAPPDVAWVEPQGDVCPTTHPIKAKLSSKVFRRPNSSGYATSKPDRCYASEDAAIAEGFREAKR